MVDGSLAEPGLSLLYLAWLAVYAVLLERRHPAATDQKGNPWASN